MRVLAVLLLGLVLLGASSDLAAQFPEIKIEVPKIELPKVDLPVPIPLPIPVPNPIPIPPVVPNPLDPTGVGKTIEDAGKALGINSETTAVVKAAFSPAVLLTEEERQKLPPDLQALTKRAAEAAEKTAIFAVRSAVTPYKLQSDLGQKVIARESVNETWGTVVDAWRTTSQDATAATKAIATTVNTADNMLAQRVERAAGDLLGDAGRQAVRTALLTTYYADALGITAAETLDLIANGKDPAMLLAAPLAIELEKAYKMHIGTAKPLPDAIKEALRGVYSNETLSTAKWTVGQVEISLPNVLNRGHQIFKEEHAVTVGDLVIFSVAPGTSRDWWWYWAHEIRHTEQYRELGGISGFAWAYIQGWESVEADARAYERRAYKDTPAPTAASWNYYLARAEVRNATSLLTECTTAAGDARVIVAVEHWSSAAAPCAVNTTSIDATTVKSDQVLLSRHIAKPCYDEAHRYVEVLAKSGFQCAAK